MSLDALAKGDGTKWNYYLEMNVVEFLNRLSFLKAKNLHEEEIIRKQTKT